MTKCEMCKRKFKEFTELSIVFNIKEPTTMRIECKNNYEHLSMADTITFRKELHKVLDKSLDEIATQIFCDKTKS